MHPKVLVLDEPTSGLDPYYCSELRKIINAVIEDGCTVIELTHSMEDAAETDQIIVLHEGDLVFSGSPHQTFTHFSEENSRNLVWAFLMRLLGRNVCPTLLESTWENL